MEEGGLAKGERGCLLQLVTSPERGLFSTVGCCSACRHLRVISQHYCGCVRPPFLFSLPASYICALEAGGWAAEG